METDFLVIGSGIAGLTFALKASKIGKVVVVTKRDTYVSNTANAQGGIAIPTSKEDEEKHIADTLRAGRGICNKNAVRLIVKNANPRIRELLGLGVKFENENNKLKRTLEAGHSSERIIYNADATGRAIEHRLVTLAKLNSNIQIIEHANLLELLVKNRACHGAQILNSENKFESVFSRFAILATGGIGALYEKTTNPPIATGDGFAIAKRAGVELENMEFVQFHPTKLDVPSTYPFLISEVMRGEGGVLLNEKGAAFMDKYDSKGELAPRDVVARAIYIESKNGKVYLDMTHRSRAFLKKRFPTIYSKCLGYDIDLAEDLVPVVAAAHYSCGGIKTDLKGRTNLRNLYAIGEVACTGVHGANRLASNSLLEAMVFSHEAYLDMEKLFSSTKIRIQQGRRQTYTKKQPDLSIKQRIQRIMWEKVGLVRTPAGLREALIELTSLRKKLPKGINQELAELKNMLETSVIIAESALKRKNSLGCHFLDPAFP